MKGLFDEFRVWQGDLSAADIAAHNAAGPNAAGSPLLSSTISAIFTVAAAPLTVTANAAAQTYGTANISFSYALYGICERRHFQQRHNRQRLAFRARHLQIARPPALTPALSSRRWVRSRG